MPAVALCDTHNISAHVEFADLALKNNIQPIHGAEITLENKSNLILIAQNEIGYLNLLKIISSHFINTDDYTPSKNKHQINFNILKQYSKGIICLSRYIYGPLFKTDNIEKTAKFLLNIYKENFFLEIFRDNKENQKFEKNYVELSKKLQIPLLATNNVLFGTKDDNYTHDILLCIKQSKKINDTDRETSNSEHYFKSEEEMKELFFDLPSAITNTNLLRQKILFFLTPATPELPQFSVDEVSTLRNESLIGLKHKLKFIDEVNHHKYYTRLEFELKILIDKNFAGYFLIVSDFIKWAKKNGIFVGPGRGSGAGSLVAWSLEITDLDPIDFDLLFERFLNPERSSMPDFDIDLCQQRREEVINYVKNKYGNEKVAQIITFGKLQAKAVIRDVGRVLGLPFFTTDYMTKLVPFSAVKAVSLSQAIEEIDTLREIYHDVSNDSERRLMKEVLHISLKLEGLIRNYSTHAAGIIISKKNLLEKTAVYTDDDNKNIIQLSMTAAETMGLIKFDFLGLLNLTLIDNIIKSIYEHKKININFENCKYDDKKTYLLLAMGLSIGIFQFESLGMQNYLKDIEPSEINDLIALNSLYRPGPMDNIPSYINRKHKREEIVYLHNKLKECLESTYGIMIYQEQVMKSVQILAKYTLAEADLLRRAIGKKKPAEMENQKKKFIAGAKENGLNIEEAQNIFDQIEKFAGYGFNKSHAAAYSVIAYYTAYLKAHYTIFFFIAYLNLEINNTNKIMLLLQDMKNFNISVEGININTSSAKFALINETRISYSFAAIKGLNFHTAQIIQDERNKNGPYLSLINFISRMPKQYFSKKTLDALIKSGAFDGVEKMNQATMLCNIENIQDYIYNRQENNTQLSLLDDQNEDISYKSIENFNMLELAENEISTTGLYIKYHPLYYYKEILQRLNIKDYQHIMHLPSGYYDMEIAASILKKDNKFSKGKQFLVLIVSDMRNLFELSIFEQEIIAKILKVRDSMIFYLKVQKKANHTRISVKNAVDIKSIENYSSYMVQNLVLNVKEENLEAIKQYLDTKNEGNIIIYFILEDNFMKYKVKLNQGFELSSDDVDYLKSIAK